MPEHPDFQELFAKWANEVLMWVGFGTVVGLLAKAIMPGRDPGGPVATLMMGIGGSIIGCGVVSYFTDGQRITPISPMGLAVATGGAFVILFFARLLGGKFGFESERSRFRVRAPHTRPRELEVVQYDD